MGSYGRVVRTLTPIPKKRENKYVESTQSIYFETGHRNMKQRGSLIKRKSLATFKKINKVVERDKEVACVRTLLSSSFLNKTALGSSEATVRCLARTEMPSHGSEGHPRAG